MKNTIGTSVALTLFGESHGEYIGAVLDGLAPGIDVDEEYVSHCLSQRRPSGDISTARSEPDEYEIVSGVCGGKTTGAPICILIPNKNARPSDYEKTGFIPRPSHADFSAREKYHGFEDIRGGGHFSGRLTAPVVAAGAVVRSALKRNGIIIGTHIKRLAGVDDRAFADISGDISYLESASFPALDPDAGEKMINKIKAARDDGDSVGGVLECAVLGVPAGVGEPWFYGVESALSRALFAIPAVKGVEFGAGFKMSDMRGSEANDAYRFDGEKVFTKSNNNGGVLGGITTGMPILFSVAIKPTPSIFKEQESVDLSTMENVSLSLSGRHDPAIVHRARAVVDAVASVVVADLLALRYGTDFIGGAK